MSKTSDKHSGPLRFATGPSDAISVSVGTGRAAFTSDHAALADDAHTVSAEVMALCQHMVRDGFTPGCPPEIDGLAAQADMVMTLSDGAAFEARLIFDAISGPCEISLTRDELLAAGRASRIYTEAAWNERSPVRLSIWIVGDAAGLDVEELRGRLAPSKRATDVSVQLWHLEPKKGLSTGRSMQGALDDADIVRSWILDADPAVPELEPAPRALVSSGWLFLALAMVATFAGQQLMHVGPRPSFLGLTPELASALGGADSSLFGEWYRLGTAMFLHQNLGHLLGNLLVLALCASVSERFVGRVQTGGVFLTGGAAGALVSAAFLDPGTVSVGASAGIVTIWVFALAATMRRPHRRLRIAAMGRLRVAAILGVVGTFQGGPTTALAHLAGGLAGAAWAFGMWNAWRPRAHPVYLRVASAIALGFAVLIGWGLVDLRAEFPTRSAGLVALESLMAESDIERLRGGSLAASEEAAMMYPDDPRVHYILAHKLVAAQRFDEALEATADALERLDTVAELFASGSLEGSIRQLRVLSAEAGGVPGVIRTEAQELCEQLRSTDAGAWALERGLCE